jgi:hypothetical protein
MLTTLLGGPLDGQRLNLSGFTRETYSTRDLLLGGGAELFDAAPPVLVCNDDGNFVAAWPDGFRIWPEMVPLRKAGGFRHVYRAAEGYGYRFDRTDDTPISPIDSRRSIG